MSRTNLERRFEAFYCVVQRAEEEIRERSPLEWDPSSVDDWNTEMEEAYLGIRSYLKELNCTRLHLVPSNVQGIRPFQADNFHQALMFFLNSPRKLFGQCHAIVSPEYQAISRGVSTEVVAVFVANKRKQFLGPKPVDDQIGLTVCLRAGETIRDDPRYGGNVTQELIEARTAIPQSRVSQLINTYVPGGWKGFLSRLIDSNSPHLGLVNGGNVDGVDFDEMADEDPDE